MKPSHPLTHCPLSQKLCLVPGLFTSQSRKDSKGQLPFEARQNTKSITLTVQSSIHLNAADLRVLQGVMALFEYNLQMYHQIGSQPLIDSEREELKKRYECTHIPTDSSLEISRNLRKQLSLLGDTVTKDIVKTQGTCWGIGTLVGYAKNGSTSKTIPESLTRLAAVRIIEVVSSSKSTGESKNGESQLLSFLRAEDGEIHVALSPLLGDVFLTGTSRTLLQLNEVRGLKSDAARILHQRLSAQITPGISNQFGIGKLIGYIWQNSDAMTSATLVQRRHKLKKVLDELRAVGWKVDAAELHTDSFRITRPSIEEKYRARETKKAGHAESS